MSMKDSGEKTKEMEEANNSGRMEVSMKGTGRITLLMAMED